jgi:hypothetical protein
MHRLDDYLFWGTTSVEEGDQHFSPDLGYYHTTPRGTAFETKTHLARLERTTIVGCDSAGRRDIRSEGPASEAALLVWVQEGQIHYKNKASEFSLENGQMAVLAPEDLLVSCQSERDRVIAVAFEVDLFSNDFTPAVLPVDSLVRMHLENLLEALALRKKAEKTAKENAKKGANERHTAGVTISMTDVMLSIERLLVRALQESVRQGRRHPADMRALCEDAEERIRTHLYSEETVEDIAQAVGSYPKQLQRAFREIRQAKPLDYRRHMREADSAWRKRG